MSHREPLLVKPLPGAPTGFAGLLRMKEADRLTEDGRTQLGFLKSNAARMTEIVEGLLTLSSIGRQPPMCDGVDRAAPRRTRMGAIGARSRRDVLVHRSW